MYFEILSSPTANHLITYSDSCGGQNRNVYLLSLWLHIVASDEFAITVVDQKFMTVGHSYLPSDRDFSSIETERDASVILSLYLKSGLSSY